MIDKKLKLEAPCKDFERRSAKVTKEQYTPFVPLKLWNFEILKKKENIIYYSNIVNEKLFFYSIKKLWQYFLDTHKEMF